MNERSERDYKKMKNAAAGLHTTTGRRGEGGTSTLMIHTNNQTQPHNMYTLLCHTSGRWRPAMLYLLCSALRLFVNTNCSNDDINVTLRACNVTYNNNV